MKSKKRILEENNVCVCSASEIEDVEVGLCWMYCGKRQDLTKEQMEKIIKDNSN